MNAITTQVQVSLEYQGYTLFTALIDPDTRLLVDFSPADSSNPEPVQDYIGDRLIARSGQGRTWSGVLQQEGADFFLEA